jgi:hypothetical protein
MAPVDSRWRAFQRYDAHAPVPLDKTATLMHGASQTTCAALSSFSAAVRLCGCVAIGSPCCIHCARKASQSASRAGPSPAGDGKGHEVAASKRNHQRMTCASQEGAVIGFEMAPNSDFVADTATR